MAVGKSNKSREKEGESDRVLRNKRRWKLGFSFKRKTRGRNDLHEVSRKRE